MSNQHDLSTENKWGEGGPYALAACALGAAAYLSLLIAPKVVKDWANLKDPVQPGETLTVATTPFEAMTFAGIGCSGRGMPVLAERREVLAFRDEQGRLIEVPRLRADTLDVGDQVTIVKKYNGAAASGEASEIAISHPAKESSNAYNQASDRTGNQGDR